MEEKNMGLFGFLSGRDANADEGAISHDDFAEAVKTGSCDVIDVREPGEFASGHIPGAVNHPLSRFDPKRLPSTKTLVVICKSGGRSASALDKARAAGRENVRHCAGGTMAWQARGERIER
jgi:rhodanese-related sulfurtransferase